MVYSQFLGYDPALGPSPYTDPYAGISGYNPSVVSGQNSTAQVQAQIAYQQAMAQNQSDSLAFQKAQAAFTDAMSLGSAYGYSMGGNPYNFGSMMLPPAGTPLQSTMNTMGYAGAMPGYTGFNTGATASYQQQLANLAAQQAGITGTYAAPGPNQYSPGTWVQLDPNSAESQQYGQQVGYVQPNGQVQRVGLAEAAKMGFTPGTAVTIPYQQFMTLAQAPPTGYMTQSQANQQQYFTENQQAQQGALGVAAATGMYTAPAQQQAPGYAIDGSSYFTQAPATQQAYQARYGDPQAAMQAWVNDTNAAVTQSYQARGQTPPGGAGTPQETLQAQNQYFNQAQQLAQTYGQYYAPGAPGQAGVAGTNGPQAGQQTLAGQQQYFTENLQTQQFQQQAAQSYLNLLSQLQGPADYGKYLNVLGSTPSGIQGLVGAAAGQFVPGTGTTGQAPQGQTLQNLVGAATGYGGQQGQSQADQNYQMLTGASSGQAGAGYGANAAGTGGGTASPGGMNYQNYMAAAQGLPAPNQIAPQSWNNMTPSQQQMMGGMYQQLGYYGPDLQSMYNQSLPKYAAGSSAGNFKLV